jgi:hypothetical protein
MESTKLSALVSAIRKLSNETSPYPKRNRQCCQFASAYLTGDECEYPTKLTETGKHFSIVLSVTKLTEWGLYWLEC